MCLDAAGNLYVAHYGMRQVQVVSPEGKVIRRYPGGNLTTSNVAFGGPDMDTLYITGGIKGEGEGEGGLFRIKLPGVKGLKILPEREVTRRPPRGSADEGTGRWGDSRPARTGNARRGRRLISTHPTGSPQSAAVRRKASQLGGHDRHPDHLVEPGARPVGRGAEQVVVGRVGRAAADAQPAGQVPVQWVAQAGVVQPDVVLDRVQAAVNSRVADREDQEELVPHQMAGHGHVSM